MAAETATPEYPAPAAGASYVYAAAPTAGTSTTGAPTAGAASTDPNASGAGSSLPAPVRTPAQRRWIIAAIAVATAIVLCGIFVSGVFLGLTVGGGTTTSEQQQFPGQQGGPGFGGNR
jgi:hypothetical protein